MELLKKLSPHLADEEIARVLNCHKKRTANGNPWSRGRVRSIRGNYNIKSFDRNKQRDVVTMNETARELNINPAKIRTLIRHGVIKAKQIIAHAPYEIKRCELEKEEVKNSIEILQKGHSLRYYRGGSTQQLSFIQ